MSDEQPFTWVQFDQRQLVVVTMGRFGDLALIRDIWLVEGPKTASDNDERFQEEKQ